MPTITTVDATWDTGVTMDAAELRRSDTAMFLGDGANNGVRGGIVRHGDTSLAVSVNGSDQVTVQAGAFVIPAATGLGAYRGSLAAATSAVALTARNATNPRIDLIVIQATGTNATVKTIDGTPSSSPVAPALPAQHIELARLNVPATGGGAVTVDNAFRAYATGIGGTLYVETAARLPGSGNQKKQRAVAIDTGIEYVWDGTAWAIQKIEAFVTAGAAYVSAVNTKAFLRGGFALVDVNLTTTALVSVGDVLFVLPSGYRPPAGDVIHGDAVVAGGETPVRVHAVSTGSVTTQVAIANGAVVRGQFMVPLP